MIYVNLDMHVTERQTYDFLEWLGDIGGLFDALRYIGMIMIEPYAAYHLKVGLLTSIFHPIRRLNNKS